MLRTAEQEKPLRLTVRMAAERLAVTRGTILQLVNTGVLSPLTPNGRGNGRRIYLRPDEVEAYANGDLEGIVAYRRKQAKRKK